MGSCYSNTKPQYCQSVELTRVDTDSIRENNLLCGAFFTMTSDRPYSHFFFLKYSKLPIRIKALTKITTG